MSRLIAIVHGKESRLFFRPGLGNRLDDRMRLPAVKRPKKAVGWNLGQQRTVSVVHILIQFSPKTTVQQTVHMPGASLKIKRGLCPPFLSWAYFLQEFCEPKSALFRKGI
ncbi:hypothetical protein BaRGS_00033848 [Batillaria attramentaria]|uniref:Uncharacterized protein n=1 Tax=Batillaria attramentaria TaxID=370345 RepID=A0ABD0JIT4_9CAEN